MSIKYKILFLTPLLLIFSRIVSFADEPLKLKNINIDDIREISMSTNGSWFIRTNQSISTISAGTSPLYSAKIPDDQFSMKEIYERLSPHMIEEKIDDSSQDVVWVNIWLEGSNDSIIKIVNSEHVNDLLIDLVKVAIPYDKKWFKASLKESPIRSPRASELSKLMEESPTQKEPLDESKNSDKAESHSERSSAEHETESPPPEGTKASIGSSSDEKASTIEEISSDGRSVWYWIPIIGGGLLLVLFRFLKKGRA